MYQLIKFRYAFILIAIFLLIGCVAKKEITTVKKPSARASKETQTSSQVPSVLEDVKQVARGAAGAVMFSFKGIVTSVEDRGKSDLRNYFNVGDTFFGAYTFDSTTMDGQEVKSNGWYHKPYLEHPDSFIVIFDKDPVNLIFKLNVPMHGWNIYSISTFTDSHWSYYNYSVMAGMQGKQVGSSNVNSFFWNTYSSTTDDFLPTYPPALDRNRGSLSFRPCSSGASGGQCPVVKFKISSFTLEKLYADSD